MQKSKSFQKPLKSSKQTSNTSSRALLQLSEITVNSKDKFGLIQNLTDRTFHQNKAFEQNFDNQSQGKKGKEKTKTNAKKQSYLRKNSSFCNNNIINQIMELSNSFNMKNTNFQSSKLSDKDSDLIVFTKNELQKNKNFSQTKKSKKLLLYDNKQNEKTMSKSKSKSTHSQAIKGEPIMCRQQNMNQNFQNNEKRQSFQSSRRSSFSSRRSSINLFQQDGAFTQSKLNDLKKSFLAKISLCDEEPQRNNQNLFQNKQCFLKREPIKNVIDNNFELDEKVLKQTRQNQTQITPRQKKQIKEKYLLKLDQLNKDQEIIQNDAKDFVKWWDSIIQSDRCLNRYKKSFSQVKTNLENLQTQSRKFSDLLLQQNKKYVLVKRMSSNNFNTQKQNILFQVQRIHSQVKKKVFKKDLQQIMIFNMKVVLPSSSIMQSTISCFDNHISSTLSCLNIPILQIYEQLMNQKACKKYGMILKKQINNMNIYDNKAMNDYLKKLYDLEHCFNRVHGDDPQTDSQYLDRIQQIVEKSEEINQELIQIQKMYSDLQTKIINAENSKKISLQQKQNLINELASTVYMEYKIFQTGRNLTPQNHTSQQNTDLKEHFYESKKTIEQFKSLISQKYQKMFSQYKKIKEEKKMIEDSLKTTNE